MSEEEEGREYRSANIELNKELQKTTTEIMQLKIK